MSSCCGTKSIAEKTTDQDSKKVAQVVVPETPITPETPKPVEETVEEVEKEEIPIEPKPEDIVESIKVEDENSTREVKKDSVEDPGFNQVVTKRTFSNIHDLWNELLQKHVSDQGNVNYKSFKTDHKELLGYIHMLNMAKSDERFQTISKERKLAYWINAYNALTIDLILRNYPTKSIKDIKNPWSQRLWKLGQKWYTLNDIEHRIIRKMDEPRIHFALVCAAVSCPRLYNKAFTAENLENDLSLLTRGFLSDPAKNNISANSIKLSKIFKWYGGDFKNNGSTLIDFLNEYSDVTISPNAKKSYKDYNWALNE